MFHIYSGQGNIFLKLGYPQDVIVGEGNNKSGSGSVTHCVVRVLLREQSSKVIFHITIDTNSPSMNKYHPLFLSFLKVTVYVKNGIFV